MNFKKSLRVTVSVLGLGLFLWLVSGPVESSLAELLNGGFPTAERNHWTGKNLVLATLGEEGFRQVVTADQRAAEGFHKRTITGDIEKSPTDSGRMAQSGSYIGLKTVGSGPRTVPLNTGRGSTPIVSEHGRFTGSVILQTTGGKGFYSSPTLGPDGTLYVGGNDGYLYAIAPDGSLKWRFFTERGYRVKSSPAVAPDGTIYVGNEFEDKEREIYKGNIYVINPDGTLKKKIEASDWVRSSPAIAPDGTVYVGSCDGNLYALNPDGSIKWKFRAGNFIFSSPAVKQDGTIYFGNSKRLFAIRDMGTYARKIWEVSFAERGEPDNWVSSSPAIAEDGTIYAGSAYEVTRGRRKYYYGKLNAVNPDGSIKWQYHFGINNNVYSSPAIGPDGTIYIGSYNYTGGRIGNIYAINPDGSLKWHFKADTYVRTSSAVSSDGLVYIADDKSLYVIDFSGNVIDKINFTEVEGERRSLSSPLIAPDGTIYIGSSNGNLYAIRNSAGKCGALADTPWPMFRKNIRRTGYAGDRFTPPLGEECGQ